MQYGDYCTELGPDGQGHKRCWPATLASVLLSDGWVSDPYQLTLALAAEIPGIEQNGVTVDQAIAQAQKYGRGPVALWSWQECLQALSSGRRVAVELDNWLLLPRAYPQGAAWDALHWVRLVEVRSDGLAVLYDPLCWLQDEQGALYQGPTLVTLASLEAATAAAPDPRWGVSLL